jgi:hypothetical protein
MPKSTNPSGPFAGMKLTDQTPVIPSGTDQRLFQPTTLPPQTVQERNEPLTREVGTEGKREVGREASLPGRREGEGSTPAFDINVRPYRKGSFMLTNEEFWALDEIKLDLQKQHDLTATKDDLARCAFRYILSDYKRQGESSFIVRVLREKARK